MHNLKKYIKKYLLLILFRYQKYRRLRLTEGKTNINILKTFPLFEACGWGLYSIRASLTIQSINQVIPALENISEVSKRHINFENEIIKSINSRSDLKDSLSKLFINYGSDKATRHDYYKVYGELLSNSNSIYKIFEIGLGTNNTDIVSTMGINGKPGASLRAFRDLYSEAHIFGADFDKRILFQEERISTYFVDQTEISTFQDLGKHIGDNFDLMIDDGLHSPNANLHSLKFFLSRIKVNGYAVIEDINPLSVKLWVIVTALLSEKYCGALVKTKVSYVYIVKRIS